MGQQQKYRIRILKRTPITTSPRPGEMVTTLAISYQANDRPVRTIWIDKEKWSLDLEKQMIRKQLEELEKRPAIEEYEI